MAENVAEVIDGLESPRPDQKAENANAAEPQPDVAPRDSQEQAEQGQAEDIPTDRVGPRFDPNLVKELVFYLALVGFVLILSDSLREKEFGALLFLILLGLVLRKAAIMVARRIEGDWFR